MNTINDKQKGVIWQDMLKYLLIAATIAFISFLFPSKTHFNYKYQQGRTWNYEDLTAPFSFALNRSEDEIDLEKSKIEEDFVPIFVKDNKAKDKFNLSVDNLDLSSLSSQINVKDFLKK